MPDDSYTEPPREFRFDEHGQLDDIVIRGVDVVHIERMSENTWWMGLTQGLTRFAFHIAGANDEVTVDVETEDEADERQGLQPDDDVIIRTVLRMFTARELAMELMRRCACTFDPAEPTAAPLLECDYHRQLREGREHDAPAGAHR